MKHAGNLLLLAGGALLVWCGTVWTGGALFNWYEARALEKVANLEAAGHHAVARAPRAHEVIGRLAIPRLRGMGLTTIAWYPLKSCGRRIPGCWPVRPAKS